jgi:nucleoside-diphosphate-sugar epimerase
MARNVLVVGASGLLGQQIARSTSTHYVIAKSRVSNEISPTGNALSVISEALDTDCTAVLFLAWPSNSLTNYDQVNEYEIWVSSCSALARLAHDKGIRFFMVGTGADTNPNPSNFYAKAKSDLKNLLSLQILNSQLTWFRPHHVYSLAPVRPRILQELLADTGGVAVVHSPNTFHDYVHAEDVARGISMAIENDLYGEIDIGSGFLTSNRNFVQVMSRQLNFKVPVFADNEEFRGVPAKIERLLSIGWKPSKTLELFGTKRVDDLTPE